MTSKIYRGLSLGNSIDFIPLHQEINHFHKVKMNEENKIIGVLVKTGAEIAVMFMFISVL